MSSDPIYPEIYYPHVTDLDLELAELIYPILVEIAPSGETITYGGVVDAVRERYPNHPSIKSLHHRHIGRRLGTIWRFTEKQGCPHIGALVINKDTGECGRGITEHLDPVLEREKIKNFDWSSLEYTYRAHIRKSRLAKEANESKPQKRNYEEAKTLFITFWKEIQSEVPINSAEMAVYRKELIAMVESGLSPATALSKKLLDLLKEGRLQVEPTEGYVYIGEYRSFETGQPLFDSVKIGYTNKDIKDRAAALSGGVVSPLHFVMTYAWRFKKGYAYIAEQRLHGALESYRTRGEFFQSMDGLIEELAGETIQKEFAQIAEPILIDGVNV